MLQKRSKLKSQTEIRKKVEAMRVLLSVENYNLKEIQKNKSVLNKELNDMIVKVRDVNLAEAELLNKINNVNSLMQTLKNDYGLMF